MTSSPSSQRGAAILAVTLALVLIATVSYLMTVGTATDVTLSNRVRDVDEARYVAEAGFRHMQELLREQGCFGYNNLPATPLGAHQYTATVSPGWMSPVTISAVAQMSNGGRHTLARNGVRVFDAPSSTVLSPGAGVDDTLINQNEPDKNYGGSTKIVIGLDDLTHGLIRFNIGSIPSGALIKVAKIRLYFDGASEQPSGSGVFVHRVLVGWSEGNRQGATGGSGTTWTKRTNQANWSAPGGDYDPTPISFLELGAADTYHYLDITSAMQEWSDGTSPNEGVLLKPSTGLEAAEFMSGDTSTSSQRPRLQLQYACECGVFNCFN